MNRKETERVAIWHDLTDGPGYCLDCRLTPAELGSVRAMIARQYMERMARLAPDLAEQARAAGVENYHTLPIPFDHGASWPKETRLLPRNCLAEFVQMDFYRRIEDQFGPAAISHDELNWRLVRPDRQEDVGPVHLDKWFWDGGYGRMPAGHDRFKVWIAVFTEARANGLLVKPFSQRTPDWKHHFELRDGVHKPVLDERLSDLHLQLLPLRPGEMVLFHDDLLHGGAVNHGRKCRVSVELTILFRRPPGAARGPGRAKERRSHRAGDRVPLPALCRKEAEG
jgi:hypothetical protein